MKPYVRIGLLAVLIAVAAALLPGIVDTRAQVHEIRLVAKNMTYYADGREDPNPALRLVPGEQVRERPQPRKPAAPRSPEAPKDKRATPAEFLREVRGELRKVAWPTRSEVINYSIIVLVAVVVLTAFIALVDFGVSEFVLKLYGE